MKRHVLSLDLGSSSGRAILGSFDGERLEAKEVGRFYHQPRELREGLCWDMTVLRAGVESAIGEAEKIAGSIDAIGIDTWGVDYVVLSSRGEPVLPARTYRNARVERFYREFESAVPPEVAWAVTGIPNQTINTSAQLFADLRGEDAACFDAAAHVLLLPDYFAYLLTGELGWSAAIASTTGLATPGARGWSEEMLGRVGAKAAWFGDISPERSVVGTCCRTGAKVIRSGTHDTAAAVHSLGSVADGDLYISCGSWTLTGTLVDEPVLDADAHLAGLTNEVRVDGGIRLLSNGTGLWIMQQAMEQWRQASPELDVEQVTAEAAAAPSAGWVFDPNEPSYAAPGQMADRVAQAAARDGVTLRGRGQVARTILESIAVAQARAMRAVSPYASSSARVLMVGGGVHNSLLCQLIADACRREVETHSAEGSALGSLIAQLQTLGDLAAGDAPTIETNLEHVRTYHPVQSARTDYLEE